MEAIMNPFNIQSQLTKALKVFEKAKKDLEKVINKATQQHIKAKAELETAEKVILSANKSLGHIRQITEGVE